MDFYTEQDNARRNARWLLLLFLLAVAMLIGITNLIFSSLLFFLERPEASLAAPATFTAWLDTFSWDSFSIVSLAVVSTVFLVVLFKWAQLAAGGKAIAERLGGQRILPNTDDPQQRRCLNAVEEMALAAGLPVPPVYLLAGERGINAFAAGISPSDAVIGVTRGTIDNFDRNQLQGVIAHEFSHILNGDMRLNIRLAAMLKGITFIGDVGEVLVRGGRHQGRSYSKSEKMPAPLLVAGLVLWIMGWLGGLFAGFIKAAISRQKEYLADASAVQFTRDPQGIADALKVIGGYVPGTYVIAGQANELSHIFFGQIADSLLQVFATHPPLADRIRRLDPQWDGQYIEFTREQAYTGTPADQVRREQLERATRIATTAALVGAMAGAGAESAVRAAAADADFSQIDTRLPDAIPQSLQDQAHDPLGAQSIAYALLLAPDGEIRQRQLALLAESGVRGLAQTTDDLAVAVAALPVQQRLPLLELSLPALKCMSPPQYQVFRKTLLRVAHSDRQIDLFEWCVYQVIRHYLDPEFVPVKPSRPRYRKAVQVRQAYRTVLSVLAWHGHADASAREAAFARGVQAVGLHNLVLLPLEDCAVGAFSQAVHKLGDSFPLLKPRLLKGMAACASHDDKLTATEIELLVSVAAVMDCPVPASVRIAAQA